MSTMTFSHAPVRARTTALSRASRQARPAAAGGHEAGGLRLTRRGRLAIVLLVAVVATVGMLFGRGQVVADSESSGAAVTHQIVQPGDTLWGIASELRPGQDPRSVIHRIMDLNGLTSAELRAGQRLVVPADVLPAQ